MKTLKQHTNLAGHTYFKVFTVDSYQGEENDVILLSLVRSNDYLNVGFLDSKNRLVVALSRARRGLYIFGNAITLNTGETTEEGGIGREPLWVPLTEYMAKQHQLNLDRGLPTVCQKHGKLTEIREAGDFEVLSGGCEQKCRGVLTCGHRCRHTCHPNECDQIICMEACTRILACGHGCSNFCGNSCMCQACFAPKLSFVHESDDFAEEHVASSWGQPESDTDRPQSKSDSRNMRGTLS